ncbi:MAG: DUF898 family protein [Clostridia bacterium]|nr:DUF898 family protein [Clostridia bacterium]
MKTCINCGTEYDSNFCPNCGYSESQSPVPNPNLQENDANVVSTEKSKFHGTIFGWFGVRMLVTLGTIFSLGIAFPWLVCFRQKYIASRTTINGRKQRFDGNGLQLLGKYILWVLLAIVTLGVGAFFLKANMHKWIVSHTHFADEPEAEGESNKSYYDGSLLMYAWISAVSGFVKVISLGFASPWMYCWKERYMTNHSVIDGHRLDFDGMGVQFCGKKFLWSFLTILTCGVYSLFRAINVKKWTLQHTNLEELVLEEKAAREEKKRQKREARRLKWQDPAWKKSSIYFIVAVVAFAFGIYMFYPSILFGTVYTELFKTSFLYWIPCIISLTASLIFFVFSIRKSKPIKRIVLKKSARVCCVISAILVIGASVWFFIDTVKFSGYKEGQGFKFTLTEDGAGYSVCLDEDSPYCYNELCKSKDLQFPSEHKGLPVVAIETHMVNYGATVYDFESVTIPDSVTRIGDHAFFGYQGLTSVTIPNSVTSIGERAFIWCTNLTSVTIPDGVTSIGDATFCGCESLTSITIPNSVTSIGEGAFEECTGLTSVTIPNGVTSIGKSAFSGCESLTNIEIPDSVTSIGQFAFSACTGLTRITIPNSVTSIGGAAFSDCIGLTSITIPNSVTSIDDYAFRDCTGLTSITIPNSVTSIGHSMFDGCTGLTDISFKGTIAEWDSISKERGWNNDNNKNHTIHCTDGDTIYY